MKVNGVWREGDCFRITGADNGTAFDVVFIPGTDKLREGVGNGDDLTWPREKINAMTHDAFRWLTRETEKR